MTIPQKEKPIDFPLFLPQIAYEKSQSNPRLACALKVCISTQNAILAKVFSDIAPLRSFYSDLSTQNNARKRKNQIFFLMNITKTKNSLE